MTYKLEPSIMVKMENYIAALDEAIAWHARGILMGYTVKRRDRGWLLIVRMRRKEENLVTFIDGEDLIEVWALFSIYLKKETLDWRHDQFAK